MISKLILNSNKIQADSYYILKNSDDKVKPYVQEVLNYFTKVPLKIKKQLTGLRKMTETLPITMQKIFDTPQSLLNQLNILYFEDKQVLDQSVLEFLFQTNQIDLLVNQELQQWFDLKQYDFKELFEKHFLVQDKHTFLTNLSQLRQNERDLSKAFNFDIQAYLLSLFKPQCIKDMFISKQAFELDDQIQPTYDIFASFALKYYNSILFVQGHPQFLLNVKQQIKKKLGQPIEDPPIENTLQIGLACYFDHKSILFDTIPQYTNDIISQTSKFSQLNFINQLQFINNQTQLQFLKRSVNQTLRDAFSKLNLTNIELYCTSLFHLHQTAFIEAGHFYAEKIYLTDLSFMIFQILETGPQELLIATVISIFSQLELDCFQSGKIQKSTQNALIFLLRIVHHFKLTQVETFLLQNFEQWIIQLNILGVFALRELIWLKANFTQSKLIDSVQRNVDICTLVESNNLLMSMNSDLIQKDQLFLSLTITSFSHYFCIKNCNDNELSDLIILTKNDLFFVFQSTQLTITKLYGDNTPYLLPLALNQKHLFNQQDVIYYSQIFNFIPFQLNTPLEVLKITNFILNTPRQHFDQLINFLIFHLHSGRKTEIQQIFKFLTISTLKNTRSDSERIGDFLINFYQKIDNFTVLFQIQTFFILKLSEKLNAVQALVLALKLGQIPQFQSYLMLIKNLVVDMYGDVNEDDSVLLRVVCQQFNGIQDQEIEIEVVDNEIVGQQKAIDEFMKWGYSLKEK